MSDELTREIDRIGHILASVELPLRLNAQATEEQISDLETRLGITFDSDLRTFWKWSNGCGSRCAAVLTDQLTGCHFPSLEDALKAWSWFEPYDESVYSEWSDDAIRDKRIQPRILHHRRWFPIAEFNGYSTAVYFDADPAPSGNYGQIIAYQHDPDAIYYVSANFTEFLRRSNDLLESNIVPLLFLDDFERICHMRGVEELARQINAGLDLNQRNWRGRTLSEVAKESGREDVIEYLRRHNDPI